MHARARLPVCLGFQKALKQRLLAVGWSNGLWPRLRDGSRSNSISEESQSAHSFRIQTDEGSLLSCRVPKDSRYDIGYAACDHKRNFQTNACAPSCFLFLEKLSLQPEFQTTQHEAHLYAPEYGSPGNVPGLLPRWSIASKTFNFGFTLPCPK